MKQLLIAGACCATLSACSDGSRVDAACTSDPPSAAALRAGAWNPGFVLPGVNGDAPAVFTTAAGSDGGLYAGGNFSSVGSMNARNVARWTTDDGWSALGEGVEGVVTASALAPDGALWVATSDWADDFSSYWHTIRRWDGGWQAIAIVTLPPGLGEPQRSGVQRMIFDAGGRLVVAGDFSAIDGVPVSRIASLGPGGWDGLGADPDGPVYALLADGSGLCVGGEFGTIGGVTAARVACRIGSGWTGFDLMDTLGGGAVRALARAADGALFAGGSFSLSDPATNDGGSVARWNGNAWELLDRGVGTWDAISRVNTPGLVRDMTFVGNELFVGGSFENAGGTSEDGRAVVDVLHLARIVPETGGWEDAGMAPLDVGIAFAADNVYSIATNGAELYAGGLFSSVGRASAFNVARYSEEDDWAGLVHPGDGSLGVEGTVNALAAGSCEIFLGGSFARAGGIEASNVASFRPDTGFSALGDGLDDQVTALTVHPVSADLYAAGTVCVETPGLLDCANSRIMRWNGGSWSTFAETAPIFFSALGFDADGILYGAGGGEAGNVVRLTEGGWEPVGGDVGGPAVALLVEAGGAIVVGGTFQTAGDVAARNVARWDGDGWSALGAGLENPVLTLAQLGERIVAGTQKGSRASATSALVAEWDGTIWTDIGTALEQNAFDPQIQQLVSGGDYLVAVGQFPFLGGAALFENGSWDVIAGMNQLGRDAVLRPEGLYIGGGFSTVEDQPSVGLGLRSAER